MIRVRGDLPARIDRRHRSLTFTDDGKIKANIRRERAGVLDTAEHCSLHEPGKNPGRCRRAVDYVNPHIRQQSPLSPLRARA